MNRPLELHNIKLNKCKREVSELKTLLKKSKVGEKTLQRFFRERKNLWALMGMINTKIEGASVNLGREFSFWGDFSCDFVVANEDKSVYTFIEFEEYSNYSIFKKIPSKNTWEYARKFEHGYSQIVDWFCRIDGFKSTQEMKKQFGQEAIKYKGVLIIGRKRDLDADKTQRLAWRTEFVTVQGREVSCMTFDELQEFISNRIKNLEILVPKKRTK